MLINIAIFGILFLMILTGPLANNPVLAGHSPVRIAHGFGVSFWSSSMGIIYVVRNMVNGKKYIGQTIQKLSVRRCIHERLADEGAGWYFHRAIRRYGASCFVWRKLAMSDDVDELNSLEITMIRLLGTKVPNGYNMTDGGQGIRGRSYKRTLAYKRKMSGVKTGVKRKPFTPEHIEKLRQSSIGRKYSQEFKDKKSELVKKQWESEKFRNRVSTRMKELWANPEWRSMMCDKFKKAKSKL